jgi:High potential iron-sulfur protein
MTPAYPSRREALRTGAHWLLVPTFGALTIVADPVAAKVSKSDVFYRDAPKEGKSCAACRLFTPSESGSGTCAVVEGPVSANGWCMAFSARAQ